MKRIASLLVVLSVLLTAVPAAAEVTQDDLREARAEMNAKAAELQEQTERLNAIERAQADYEARIAQLEHDIATQERQIALQALAAKDQARSAYVSAGAASMSATASPESVVRLSTKTAYLGVVSNTNVDAANRLEYLRADQDVLKETLQANLAEQEALAEEAQAISDEMQARLTAANDEYQTLYSQWEQEEAERQRKAAEARAAAAEAAAAAAAKAAGIYNGPIDPTGRMCPVAGAVYFRDSWGEPRSGGRTHTGTDMIAAMGTPLVSVENGYVWVISWDPLGGNGLFIRGDGGDVYYYAHLSGYVDGLAEGQRVDVGQYVGYVGQTGDASTPHLHFGWFPGGYSNGLRNPYPLVSQLCG